MFDVKKNASPNDARRPSETRGVPETGVWARLVRSAPNANSELRANEHVLLTHPGRVEVVDRFADGAAVGLYRTARAAGGCVAPDAALVWLPAQAFSRLSAQA